MNLRDIQKEAWAMAESKGLHDSLDKPECFGHREQVLADSAWLFHAVSEIVQDVKRLGMRSEVHFRDWQERLSEVVEDFISLAMQARPVKVYSVLDASRARLSLVGTEVAESVAAVGTSHLGPELADILIRLADLSETVGIDLGTEVEKKMAHNRNRPHGFGTPSEMK